MAATAIGLQVGVAKQAEVVAVRILDCTGSGTISDTVAGLGECSSHQRMRPGRVCGKASPGCSMRCMLQVSWPHAYQRRTNPTQTGWLPITRSRPSSH